MEANSNLIAVKHLPTFVDDNERFEQTMKYEHSYLPRGFTASAYTAGLPQNTPKNRSPCVVAYDKNRSKPHSIVSSNIFVNRK